MHTHYTSKHFGESEQKRDNDMTRNYHTMFQTSTFLCVSIRLTLETFRHIINEGENNEREEE